jgi:hypothetical protein
MEIQIQKALFRKVAQTLEFPSHEGKDGRSVTQRKSATGMKSHARS